MKNQAEEQEEQEGKFYCGICGWVAIEEYPHCHKTQDAPTFTTLTLDDLIALKDSAPPPTIVCLCGSTRFAQAFQDANLYETLKGNIVLSIGCNTKSDDDLVKAGIAINKEALDTLHLSKIDLADEVLILNCGGYVGESTLREIAYAEMLGKSVRWLEVQE